MRTKVDKEAEGVTVQADVHIYTTCKCILRLGAHTWLWQSS